MSIDFWNLFILAYQLQLIVCYGHMIFNAWETSCFLSSARNPEAIIKNYFHKYGISRLLADMCNSDLKVLQSADSKLSSSEWLCHGYSPHRNLKNHPQILTNGFPKFVIFYQFSKYCFNFMCWFVCDVFFSFFPLQYLFICWLTRFFFICRS